MENYLSKFTLGFLMAQLFPGAIATTALTCPVLAGLEPATRSLSDLFRLVTSMWFGSTRSVIVFLFVAGAVGMLIHGLDWLVLAWLENGRSGTNAVSVRRSFWHNRAIWIQLLILPIKMILEILWTLTAPSLNRVIMRENVPDIPHEKVDAFNYLQDFYLYFAQFYIHTSYALVFSLAPLILSWQIIGWTRIRSILLLVVYALGSILFLIGRAQLTTLFRAEEALKDPSSVNAAYEN